MSATGNPGRAWIVLAGLSGATAVAISAWASHGLAASIAPELLQRASEQARSATQMHLIHSLALLGVGILSRHLSSRWLHLAGLLFVIGIVLFAFGIYALYLWWPSPSGPRYLVPVGGVGFIAGWLALAIAGLSGHMHARRP